MGIPCKTAAGHAELAARDRQLSQRHRTLLFLVDGQRPLTEVLRLGALAGVPRAYLDELIALGLVVVTVPLPQAPVSPSELEVARTEGLSVASIWAAARLHDADVQAHEGRSAEALNWKAVWSLEGMPQESSSHQDSIGFGDAAGETELAALAVDDPLLDQARQVVLQALRHTAPVVGAVTMLRVRRSRSRAQLRALLPEVQARLSRPRHLADARLVIQRVEALLSR